MRARRRSASTGAPDRVPDPCGALAGLVLATEPQSPLRPAAVRQPAPRVRNGTPSGASARPAPAGRHRARTAAGAWPRRERPPRRRRAGQGGRKSPHQRHGPRCPLREIRSPRCEDARRARRGWQRDRGSAAGHRAGPARYCQPTENPANQLTHIESM